MLHMKSCAGEGCTWCAAARRIVAEAAKPAPAITREAAIAKWDSPLVAAAATGDVDWVKELIAEGTDVNELSPGSFEFMPLIVAAQKGHVEVVRMLLQTGECDLTKKHMNYINALDSALHGYCNLEGCNDEFSPQIRAMIIRAHVETADRIKLDTLLHIEASGAVLPEQIKAFRSGMGARNKMYSKAKPGKLDLNDPPAAKMQSVISAARFAARRIAAEKADEDAAAAIAAGKAKKIMKSSGPSGVPSRLNAFGGAGCSSSSGVENDDDDGVVAPKKVAVYDPMLDDSYGKMSRRFNF